MSGKGNSGGILGTVGVNKVKSVFECC